MNEDRLNPSDLTDATGPARPTVMAEPFAFALVTWPAVVGLLAATGWPGWSRICLAIWLAAMHLAAYSRGAGFGNIMLFLSGVVALACYGHPSPWTLAWLPALLIGLHAAQRVRLKVTHRADTPQVDSQP